ncbi:MAG: DNA repair protein RadA [Thermotogaceae bacterium]|nr:DNA repair protein RadA [Thermotogaceae bacterium]
MKTFVCENCGYESPKWFGRCPVCGQWNTAKEVIKGIGKGSKSPLPSLIYLSKNQIENQIRISSNIDELDRILGGGFVKGQAILLGGEPGIGKSTLALQISDKATEKGLKVLYASGEESIDQIFYRAKRIDVSSEIVITTEQNIDTISEVAKDFDLLIIDSIQTFYTPDLGSIPGSISQIRAVTGKMVKAAKENQTVILLIGHITKSGDIAGPKIVEHMVDTVLYFEGERTTDYRIIRVFKNRFGPSGEIAIFEMTSKGLNAVKNPVFIEDDIPFGNAIACVLEGSKPIIVQVQALVSRSKIPSPRRTAVGIDITRVNAVVAVMSKLLKLPLDMHEIYVKILGGMRITDPGLDLAISSAILSSLLEKELSKIVFIGEVGLDGKIRLPFATNKRIETVVQSGFKEVAAPATPIEHRNLIVHETRRLSDLISIMG